MLDHPEWSIDHTWVNFSFFKSRKYRYENHFKFFGDASIQCYCFHWLWPKKVVEDTIIVEGVCGMCKSRIEEAAFGKGVKFVEWTNSTSELAIAYRSDKTSMEEIEARVAKAGHNTQNIKATKEDYESLP